MGSETDEYAKFQEKVKRTVYIDNLSPAVTKVVIEKAFEQYGNVGEVHFIQNYTEPYCASNCALVDLGNEKEAKVILDMLSSYPFMMAGMPRPVKGREAKPEMFPSRPPEPGRKIQVRWLDHDDPDFGVAQKLKSLAKTHVAERFLLHKIRLDEEKKLSERQEAALKAHQAKYDLMDGLGAEGISQRLAKRYGVHMPDD